MAGEMVRAAGRLRAGVMEAGFTEEAWGLAEGVLGCWERWGREGVPGLPEGAGARMACLLGVPQCTKGYSEYPQLAPRGACRAHRRSIGSDRDLLQI